MREQVSDEICNCGHRKSQHEAIVCGWWNCRCKQFEPLTAPELKRERKPVEEFPHAGNIISADVVAQEISADVAAHEISADVAVREVSADVAAHEVEELRSKLVPPRKRSRGSNSFKMEITSWQLNLALKTTC